MQTKIDGLKEIPEEAHPSLHVLESFDYERVKRHFGDDAAKIWDLVRRCSDAEDATSTIIDVHRLSGKIGQYWFIALGFKTIETGWLGLNPVEQQKLQLALPNTPDQFTGISMTTQVLNNFQVSSESELLPTRADLLRRMRDINIGRPSTYHSHIASVIEMVGLGYIDEDDEGRFALTARGAEALAILRTKTFPGIGIEYSAELEEDLDSIENGLVDAYDIAVKHLSLLTNIKDVAKNSRSMPNENRYSTVTSAQMIPGLPITIDPEVVLPNNHRLRITKNNIVDCLSRMEVGSSTAAQSGLRAAVAAASARLWNLNTEERILDELQFNLAYRWLCNIEPDDLLWTPPVFHSLVQKHSDLYQAVKVAIENSPREWQ